MDWTGSEEVGLKFGHFGIVIINMDECKKTNFAEKKTRTRRKKKKKTKEIWHGRNVVHKLIPKH